MQAWHAWHKQGAALMASFWHHICTQAGGAGDICRAVTTHCHPPLEQPALPALALLGVCT